MPEFSKINQTWTLRLSGDKLLAERQSQILNRSVGVVEQINAKEFSNHFKRQWAAAAWSDSMGNLFMFAWHFIVDDMLGTRTLPSDNKSASHRHWDENCFTINKNHMFWRMYEIYSSHVECGSSSSCTPCVCCFDLPVNFITSELRWIRN